MKRVLALVALAGLFLVACGSTVAYAAKVDNTSISQSDVDTELRAIQANKGYADAIQQGQTRIAGSGQGTFDSGFVAKVLTRQILYELVSQEVARRKLKIGQTQLDTAQRSVVQQVGGQDVFNAFSKTYRDRLVRRTAEVETLTDALNANQPPVTGDAARAYFSTHAQDFANQVCASHILVATVQQADSIEMRLAAGQDFAAIARAESTDKQSGTQGGDLGCSDPSQYVAPFAQALTTQAVGQVGPPVQTQFGFHVIKVTARPPTFAQVENQVLQKLQQDQQSRFSTWLDDTVKKAKITVNPRYGTFSKDGPQPGVVPPQAPTTTTSPPPGGAGPSTTAPNPAATTAPSAPATTAPPTTAAPATAPPTSQP